MQAINTILKLIDLTPVGIMESWSNGCGGIDPSLTDFTAPVLQCSNTPSFHNNINQSTSKDLRNKLYKIIY